MNTMTCLYIYICQTTYERNIKTWLDLRITKSLIKVIEQNNMVSMYLAYIAISILIKIQKEKVI